MSSVAEHFAMLRLAGLPSGESTLRTRTLPISVAAGPILLGMDGLGQRHLLVPVGDAEVVPDRASRGVVTAERGLVLGDAEHRFLDLSCLSSRLDRPFEQLAEDVLRRITESSDDPRSTVSRTLEDWREMLRAAQKGMSRESIVGLTAELELLASLAAVDPLAAIDAWVGPDNAVHDFKRGSRSIEVKATSAVDPSFVHISNVDQLDPAPVAELLLAVFHLRESPSAPNLEERVEALHGLGVPESLLADRLRAVGYTPRMELAFPDRLEVRSFTVFAVGHSFPSVRSTDIRPDARLSVRGLEYDLVLAGLPDEIPEAEVAAALADWMTA
ncbi:PD-(D/E)XK motif protein [Nocardioides jejuensis]|uniref:PD-(D/E)XK motif protein n=1 Tax=Nocardioides jejuensis TaxID=2502782 RepID=A0A4R1CI42_9ACTN|nr:PD-(D/E)XK motif protein [Nocardioides jejuensis]TCJ30427.1 PD-(D/E)XK motif protein [Nocardioides jejuensis]